MSSINIPATYSEIVSEILCFTSFPREEVEQRVWMQAIEPGWNVLQDVQRFGVTPHKYDDHMLQLYRDGDGFIFETLVFWAKPFRQKWTSLALDRLELYSRECGVPADQMKILMFGDGCGNDSLYLAGHGYKVDYFDVPGSKTYDFALRRFEHYGLLGNQISPVLQYEDCLHQSYDAVICFEVLEHLPQPADTIKVFPAMVKEEGILLITDDFGDITERLPTHLKTNTRYMGMTPFLFSQHGMQLTWYNRADLFKPSEYRKKKDIGFKDRTLLIRDANIRGLYFSRYLAKINKTLGKLAYAGR
jgi:SAM-dependent methyltransferase